MHPKPFLHLLSCLVQVFHDHEGVRTEMVVECPVCVDAIKVAQEQAKASRHHSIGQTEDTREMHNDRSCTLDYSSGSDEDLVDFY